MHSNQWLSEEEHYKIVHITAIIAAVVGVLVGVMLGVSIAKERMDETVCKKTAQVAKMECPKP